MCGRFMLTASGEELMEMLDLEDAPQLSPRHNISPTQAVGLVRVNAESLVREWTTARWGLIPHWTKDLGPGPVLFNARAETVAQKPTFRDALRRRRCLIPADGFYEWKPAGKRKIPYLIRMKDKKPFAFAGLWDRWESGPEPAVESCTIITTEPNDVLREIHSRMPAILKPTDYEGWLNATASPDALRAMLVPFQGALAVAALAQSPRGE